MMFSNILFIINPISGTTNKSRLIREIESMMQDLKPTYRIEYTRGPSHATDLAREAEAQKADLVVAVGGDGTMNETASALINTDTTLALIPYGSGNGLSRHLGIPNDPLQALELLSNGTVNKMDVCSANDIPFFNVAGVGFDALIAHEFAKLPRRGFWSYAREIYRQWPDYTPEEYILKTPDKEYTRRSLLVSFANGSQYGNNFSISPQASVKDGLIDVCILRKFPHMALPSIIWRMYTGKLHSSRYAEIFRCTRIEVQQNSEFVHLDGEPYKLGKNIRFKVLPKALNILAPKVK